MTMRILIPAVDSVNAWPAVTHAAREFLGGERFDVHLLYVRSPWSPFASRPSAERALQPARALLERLHIRHWLHVRVGDKSHEIHDAARRLRADRIVLGTARHWSATRLSEDAVIRRVLEGASVPVTIVSGKSVSPVERFGIAAGLGATFGLILLS
jgi:nucleotide-binding universal stress UspA family protein